MPEPAEISIDTVSQVLTALLDGPVKDVRPLGAGAWSRAYAFDDHPDRGEPRQLVARFGRHLYDFEADRDAMAFDGPDLPVPKTILIAPTDPFGVEGYVSVTERASGDFPDGRDGDGWRALVPAWSAMLRTLWRQQPQTWPDHLRQRFGAATSWADRLLSVADEPADADERNRGWKAALQAAPGGDTAFVEGFAVLRRLAESPAIADLRTTMVHSDLINRNVLVAGDRITAVFDWGCGIVGDPLYDLAWLDFWSPWHPGLKALDVRQAFAPLIDELGRPDKEIDLRWRAGCLHIGLGHLAYNANIGDHDNLAGTTRRLAAYL